MPTPSLFRRWGPLDSDDVERKWDADIREGGSVADSPDMRHYSVVSLKGPSAHAPQTGFRYDFECCVKLTTYRASRQDKRCGSAGLNGSDPNA